jgi:hypothetical protein
VVTHRELLGTVRSSVLFEVLGYRINPGLKQVFPWLSTIANSFERYRFSKLEFEYVPRVGYNSQGSVYFGIDYDVKEDLPANEQQMCAYEGSIEAPPYRPFLLRTKPGSLATGGTKLFTRSTEITSGDLSLYDAGMFLVGTQDFGTSDLLMGKIWVNYVVHFETPQIPATGAPAVQPGMQTVFFKNTNTPAEGPIGSVITPLKGATIGLDQLKIGRIDEFGGFPVPVPGCYRIEGSCQVTAPSDSKESTVVDISIVEQPPFSSASSEELATSEWPEDAKTGSTTWSRIIEVLEAGTILAPKMAVTGYDFATSPAGAALIDFVITYLGAAA